MSRNEHLFLNSLISYSIEKHNPLFFLEFLENEYVRLLVSSFLLTNMHIFKLIGNPLVGNDSIEFGIYSSR